jgi:hypothetical protein
MYKEYYLSSQNADNGDYNSPIWSIPSAPYVDRFRIDSVTLPLSYYPVGNQNNVIKSTENGVTQSYFIPPGSYTVANIAQTLQSVMPGYTVTFDEVSRKLTFQNSTSFYFLPASQGTSAYRIIGSPQNRSSSSGTTVTMPNVVDLTNNNPLLLTSTSLSSQDIVFAGKNVHSNILTVIPLDSPVNAYHTYNNNNGSFLSSQQNLTLLDFQILDSSTLRPVDFQGQPFFVKMSVLTDIDDLHT